MITAVNHVGIAVRDLEESARFFREALGLEEKGRQEVPDQNVRVAFFELAGVSIELLESTSPDGPIARHIAKRGPGLHHLTLTTGDIVADLSRIAKSGAELIDKEPRAGAHGSQIAFIHPKSAGGVLLELCEPERNTAKSR